MSGTPDVRPVGDLPDAIGKTAARELAAHGVTSLASYATWSRSELLAIHGVGPKAVRILDEALAAQRSQAEVAPPAADERARRGDRR